MARIDAMGGAVVAVEQGFIQDEIARSAYRYQRDVEEGRKVIVGVNKFQVEEAHDTPLLRIDDSIREEQSRKLQSLRSRRDATKVKQALEKVRSAAAGTANLMPVVIEAVEHLCTLGEIADQLRAVYGEHK